MIQWTEKGKAGTVRLNELFEEAGAGKLNGRQVALFGLIAFASYKVGMDNNNVTSIGDADLSREEVKTDSGLRAAEESRRQDCHFVFRINSLRTCR